MSSGRTRSHLHHPAGPDGAVQRDRLQLIGAHRGVQRAPVRDASGRTFTNLEFTLTVSMELDASKDGGRANAAMLNLLMQPAAELIYSGHGTGGDMTVNLNFAADVKWGPFPTEARLVPQGVNGASKLIWSVQWSTLICADAKWSGPFPLEFCWRAGYHIDESGLTTRTISGFVAVPATRFAPADRRLPQTADVLREAITPPLLPGFRRCVPGDFEFDYAKTRCDFQFVDAEFPGNIPPPGVIEGSLEYALNQQPGQPYLWYATISASYELARGMPASAAWTPFYLLIAQEKAAIAGARGGGGLAGAIGGAINVVGRAVTKVVVMPWQFSMTNPNFYGKPTVRLSAVLKITVATLPLLLARAGLWRPLPNSNWSRWAAAIPAHLSPRGTAGLVLRAGDDAITDLCAPAAPTITTDLRAGPGVALGGAVVGFTPIPGLDIPVRLPGVGGVGAGVLVGGGAAAPGVPVPPVGGGGGGGGGGGAGGGAGGPALAAAIAALAAPPDPLGSYTPRGPEIDVQFCPVGKRKRPEKKGSVTYVCDSPRCRIPGRAEYTSITCAGTGSSPTTVRWLRRRCRTRRSSKRDRRGGRTRSRTRCRAGAR